MPQRLLLSSVILLFAALPLAAQDWSVGVSTGPFVFGNFVERTIRTGTETSVSTTTLRLTAATRPGLAVDIERRLADHWGLRLEGTFTESKLSVKSSSGEGVHLDAGKMDVTTWTLPIVFHFSRHGAFRVHLFGGPAYATYRIRHREGNSAPIQEFTGTRGRTGAVVGGGVGWWLSDRTAIEGNIQDIVTESPFNRSDFPASTTGLKISKPHNVHTTVGVRYRF